MRSSRLLKFLASSWKKLEVECQFIISLSCPWGTTTHLTTGLILNCHFFLVGREWSMRAHNEFEWSFMVKRSEQMGCNIQLCPYLRGNHRFRHSEEI